MTPEELKKKYEEIAKAVNDVTASGALGAVLGSDRFRVAGGDGGLLH